MSATSSGKRVAQTLAGLVLLGGTFYLGRHSAPPAAPEPTQEAKSEAPAEEPGIIRFSEESLKLAGLQVAPAAVSTLQGHLAVTGAVEPDLSGVVKITPRVAGKVTTVLANVGDEVRAGQSLGTLASTELATAQAAYRQATARVSLAVTNLGRQRKLAGLGEFGRHKVEEAREREIAAHGEINSAQSELGASRNEVAEARSEKAAFEGEVAGAESEASSAESEIIEAQGQVRSLQAALVQAQTGVKVAESKFNRYDRLLKEQLVSRQDWEQAQADLQRAESDIDAARANVAQGQAKIETAKAHLKAAQARVQAAHGRAQQAAAKIETTLSRVAEVEARLTAARKRDEVAEQALAREEKVYRGGFLTSKEILDAEAALRQSRAEQRAAAETVRLLGGTPGGGNQLTLAAPISGRVTERTVSLGETVAPERTLFTIVNLQSVWVQLNVHQKDLPSIRPGQALSVTTDAAPGKTFRGAVSYVGDLVDETTRTVKVRAVIQNRGGALKPQSFVRGKITASVRTEALAIPQDAVQDLEGKRVVFVQADHPGEFRAREVEVGDTVGGLTAIISGLEAGDQVVTRGAFLVKAQAMKSELSEE